MSKTRRVMLWVFCWLLGFGLLNAWSPTAAVFWLYGVGIITVVVKVRLWGNEKARRARLISDLAHQHAAWKAGNDRVATYGPFQPDTEGSFTKPWRAGTLQAWPTSEMNTRLPRRR